MKVAYAAVALIGVLFSSLSSGADGRAQPAPGPIDLGRTHVTLGSHTVFAPQGELRGVYGHVGAIGVTTEDPAIGAEVPAEDFAYVRLRLLPNLVATGSSWRPFQLYQLYADIDVLEGLPLTGAGRAVLVHDDEPRTDDAFETPHLNELFGLMAGPSVALKFGLTRSSWGGGLLANPGLEPTGDARRSPFGFATRGDRNVRAQLALFPLGTEPTPGGGVRRPLTLAIAGDIVIDDDTSTWSDGDRTYQGIMAIRGELQRVALGFYAVHRRQTHHEGGETAATVFDAHVYAELVKSRSLNVWIEAEGAMIFGQTTYSQNALRPGALDIVAAGGLLRFGVSSGRFDIVLETGAASGDDNPFDDELHLFTMDREHRVGLLMFREALRTVTAATAYNIADETYRGRAPRGFERVASGGAVAGAAYVNPRVNVSLLDGLTLSVGFLYAVTDSDYVDPFRSGLEGGAAVGPNGARAANQLGTEIDLGLRYELNMQPLGFVARAEFAWFDPGDVFSGPTGEEADDLLGAWVHLGVTW